VCLILVGKVLRYPADYVRLITLTTVDYISLNWLPSNATLSWSDFLAPTLCLVYYHGLFDVYRITWEWAYQAVLQFSALSKAPIPTTSSQSPIKTTSNKCWCVLGGGSLLIQIVALPVDEALTDWHSSIASLFAPGTFNFVPTTSTASLLARMSFAQTRPMASWSRLSSPYSRMSGRSRPRLSTRFLWVRRHSLALWQAGHNGRDGPCKSSAVVGNDAPHFWQRMRSNRPWRWIVEGHGPLICILGLFLSEFRAWAFLAVDSEESWSSIQSTFCEYWRTRRPCWARWPM